MNNNYRPQGSEKIQDEGQKLERIRVMAGIGQNHSLNEGVNKFNTKFSTLLHEAVAADGHTYGLVQEGPKVYLKRLVNDHYDYLTGDEKNYAYKDFATAFKHMNFVFKDISQNSNHSGQINIFEGGLAEKKNLSEKYILKTPAPQAPVNQPAPSNLPPQSGSPSFDDSGDMPSSDPSASKELGQEIGSVEGEVEGQDPVKTIQKLVGKLTEKMRAADEQMMTSDFMKYILNSVISALDVQKFEDADLLSVIKKLKGEENPESADGNDSGEFKDSEGIDYNVNNPVNDEGSKPELTEVDNEGHEEEFLFTIPKSRAGSPDYDNRYAVGKEVRVDANKFAHITRIEEPTLYGPGKAYGYYLLPDQEDQMSKMLKNAYNRKNNRPLFEEINQPTWDDQTLPNILGQVVANIGIEINDANEEELRQAVALFVNTYGGDQNQSEYIKQLEKYVQDSGSTDIPLRNVAESLDANVRYTDLSPMGQQVFDQLEELDPSMGDLSDSENSQSTSFQTPTSNSMKITENTKSFLRNKILEALQT